MGMSIRQNQWLLVSALYICSVLDLLLKFISCFPHLSVCVLGQEKYINFLCSNNNLIVVAANYTHKPPRQHLLLKEEATSTSWPVATHHLGELVAGLWIQNIHLAKGSFMPHLCRCVRLGGNLLSAANPDAVTVALDDVVVVARPEVDLQLIVWLVEAEEEGVSCAVEVITDPQGTRQEGTKQLCVCVCVCVHIKITMPYSYEFTHTQCSR